MSAHAQAYALTKALFEIATYRWKGPREHLATAWAITFADSSQRIVDPRMPSPVKTVWLNSKEVDLYFHETGPRIVVHHPDGISEIRALDVESRRQTLGRALDTMLQKASSLLGVQLSP